MFHFPILESTVLYPPNLIEIKTTPIVFLAGPIVGAPDWQSHAIEYLQSACKDILIACPKVERIDDPSFSFAKQVEWETYYLHQAACHGVILFWLAKENEHFCHRSYAQTSRFELGEWFARASFDNTEIIIGIEPGFSGADYIRHRLTARHHHISESLEEVCQRTIECYRRQY